ncbi:Splicing factor 3a, subunit 3 [Trachipleistophora hominis]|uniref:Splicing factor 3a, subunit 3 n=1 Tax=Trachipleistophora hominis TaxID=72359 RepID=L7JYQ3_TRAHO|nr:Splicing factor 3a, subunit 3 [Trachipleistophora hominis]
MKILQKITNFDLETENKFKYLFALLHLQHYLKDFVHKSRPEIHHKKIKRLLRCAESENKTWNVFDTKVYCMFCEMDITKSVFEYHAKGKKHGKARTAFLKNIELPDENGDYVRNKCENVYLKRKVEYICVSSAYVNRLEARVKLLLTFLEKELKLAVSVRGTQSIMSIEKEKKTYSMKIYRDEAGNPIPRWLYNQRGLNVEYICEICDNTMYKGRKVFESHFNSDKHKQCLMKLGITSNFDKYRGISQIRNAQKLQDKLQ